MRRLVPVSLLAFALVLAAALPSEAWSRGRGFHHGGGFHHPGFRTPVFVGIGPAFVGPWWWYDPPSAYPSYSLPPYYIYTPPPVVVEHQPSVDLQQQPPAVTPAPSAAQPPQAFWLYCASAKGYYPSVPTCSEEWIKIPTRP
jgi:hypothetical protein